MKTEYTAAIRQEGKWWIGWIAEISGVSSQAKSRRELLRDLRSALKEAIELNRQEALAAATEEFEEVSIRV